MVGSVRCVCLHVGVCLRGLVCLCMCLFPHKYIYDCNPERRVDLSNYTSAGETEGESPAAVFPIFTQTLHFQVTGVGVWNQSSSVDVKSPLQLSLFLFMLSRKKRSCSGQVTKQTLATCDPPLPVCADMRGVAPSTAPSLQYVSRHQWLS